MSAALVFHGRTIQAAEFDSALQPLVRNNLAMRFSEAMNFCEPAAELLFDRYNGSRDFFS